MKILFVVDEYFAANNGLSISAQRFTGELRRRGHTVRILAGNACGSPDYALPEYRVPIFDKLIKNQGVTFAFSDDSVIRRAVGWADVVYLENCFVLASHTAKIACEMGVPCTGAFHVYPENITSSIGLAWARPINSAILAGFRHFVFRRCSDIHCPAEPVAERIRRAGYTSRLHVISNGVTPEYIFRRSPKPEEFKDKFVILSTGRYSREKRQDVIIKAVRRSKYAPKIQLIFAGQGPLRLKYLRMSLTLPNHPVFRFMSKDELMEVMSYSDLYVHAAQVEIEGMSCMEAISSGLVPVIAKGPLTSTSQFALDGRSLFRSGDAKELTQRIDYWIEHPDELESMRMPYHQNAQKYAIDLSSAKLEKMFMTACGEKAADAAHLSRRQEEDAPDGESACAEDDSEAEPAAGKA
jgi:1,2-diacylglycerol 3-alpha-glucosyltransferase